MEPSRLNVNQLSAGITKLHARMATAYAPYMNVRFKWLNPTFSIRTPERSSCLGGQPPILLNTRTSRLNTFTTAQQGFIFLIHFSVPKSVYRNRLEVKISAIVR